MKSNNDIDMLHGPLFMKILIFALPLAASSVLQQLFNSVDVAVVGRFASSEALAAVGSNSSVINLLINLFMGISMGANVILSNHIGQHDEKSIRNAVNTITMVALCSGIFLMILGVSIARPILELMDTPHNVIDMAVAYLRIYFLGIPFFLIFDFGAAILRSRGDTRRPLYILILAGVVNTVLNLVFVICFHMGVEGVAIATGIANGVSALSIVWLLKREEGAFHLRIGDMKITRVELRRMLQVGVPAGVQGMIFSLSNVIIQSAINGYGSAAVAGSAAALNFESYSYFLIMAFNGAAISFTGQNYGAGRIDRVRRIFWICMFLGVLFGAGSNWLFIWQRDALLSLFTTDAAVLAFATSRMSVALATQSIACGYEITGSVLRGMGKSVLPAVLTVFGTCLLRITWVYVVCPHFPGFKVLMAAYPVSWLATSTMVCIAFRVVMKRQQATH